MRPEWKLSRRIRDGLKMDVGTRASVFGRCPAPQLLAPPFLDGADRHGRVSEGEIIEIEVCVNGNNSQKRNVLVDSIYAHSSDL